MKKLLSMLLCVSMLVSLVPMGAGAAESTAEGTQALEKFGFKPNPDSYDKNGLKPGSYVVEQRGNLFVDIGLQPSKKYTYKEAKGTQDGVAYSSWDRELQDGALGAPLTTHFVSTAFAPMGTGVNDHIARVGLAEGGKGGLIYIRIFNTKTKKNVGTYSSGQNIITNDSIPLYGFEGTLAITGGDFDGDGKDELAVYMPNNLNETTNGSTPADISIYILDVEPKAGSTSYNIAQKQKINIGEGTQWQYSCDEGKKQWYCLPQVALCAEDLNGDGIDDLMAALSFSTWFRGTEGGRDYTTKTILNYDSHFASVLEAFEGRENADMVQTIKHKVMATGAITDTDDKKDYRYILRDANVTVGDVTGEGSKEIIIAGNYTRADHKSTTDDSAVVTGDRYLETGGETGALSHIVGFTTYDNLKNNSETMHEGYKWTVRKAGWGTCYWYVEDNTDPCAGTVSLCSYQHYGTGNPDKIFVAGQYYNYDPQTGMLAYEMDHDFTSNSFGRSSVCWLGKAVAGNLKDDMFGREILVVPFWYKTYDEPEYSCAVLNYGPNRWADGNSGYKSGWKWIIDDVASPGLVSVAVADDAGKTSYITYEGNDAEVYYGDIEVLSIVQAPPVYEEINDGSYQSGSSTTFSKSTGSGSAESTGHSLSAGVVTGYQNEFSAFGMTRLGGIDIEASFTTSEMVETTKEVSYDYSAGFSTSGTTDAVTVFSVPYVRYNCTQYVPTYNLPTEEQYNQICSFAEELESKIIKCKETGSAQTDGTYNGGCEYYQYYYTSYVDSDNLTKKAEILHNVLNEKSYIEKAISSFGQGGIYDWGATVEGTTLPYHYNMPQTPMVTTMDAKAYDALAAEMPSLEKIYGNVFAESYRPGDPSTYPSLTTQLPNASNIISAKTNLGTLGDGFLSNSAISGGGTSQSQTISVSQADSTSVTYGGAFDSSVVADIVGIKLGFTLSAETTATNVKTTTRGNEYSGNVAGLPNGTPNDYSYDWKLISYTTKLNGSKVPVVGYLTRITNTTPPPSVAQNIAIGEVTDKTATLTWEDGHRPADYYKISRVAYDVVSGSSQYTPLSGEIRSVNGKCTYTIGNLRPNNTSYYVIESYGADGKKSVASKTMSITTLPEGFAVISTIDGIEENVIQRPGKNLSATLHISGGEEYDVLYQWQKNKGDGWKNINSQNGETYNFVASAEDDRNQIRCIATVFVGDRSVIIYSNPITLNCTNSANGYNVNWSDNSVTITPDEGAAPANIYLKAENTNGISKILQEPAAAQGVTFDISDVADDDVRLYIWEDNMNPVTYQFAK